MNVLNTSLSIINSSVNLINNTSNMIINKEKDVKTDNESKLVDLMYTKKQIDLIKEKYPNKIPIIIQKYKNSTLKDLPRNKYLVDKSTPFFEFKYKIQKKLGLQYNQTLFFFNGNNLVDNNMIIGAYYDLHKNSNGLLYINYTEENAFGFKKKIINKR